MKQAKAEKMLNGAYIVARGGLPVSPRIYSHRDTAAGVASVLNGDETILNAYAELTLSVIDTETLTIGNPDFTETFDDLESLAAFVAADIHEIRQSYIDGERMETL